MTRMERATAHRALSLPRRRLDQAAVALAEEGVGAWRRRRRPGRAKPLEVGVALCRFFPRAARGPRTGGRRGRASAQDTRWPAVGKRVMSRPISAMIAWAPCRRRCRGSHPAASRRAGLRRPGRAPASGPVAPSASAPQAAGIGDQGGLDRVVELRDLTGPGGRCGPAGRGPACGVVIAEAMPERASIGGGALGLDILPCARAARARGSRSPAIIASSIARADWCPASWCTTDDSLIRASS